MKKDAKSAATAVHKLLPESEAKWLAAAGNTDRFLARETARFASGNRSVLEDLQQLQAAKPRTSADGKTATFELASASQLPWNKDSKTKVTREVRFRLENGHWRFTNTKVSFRAGLRTFAAKGRVPAGPKVVLRLKKYGKQWRLDLDDRANRGVQ